MLLQGQVASLAAVQALGPGTAGPVSQWDAAEGLAEDGEVLAFGGGDERSSRAAAV